MYKGPSSAWLLTSIFPPTQNHWIWIQVPPGCWIPRPDAGPFRPRIPELPVAPFVLNLTLVLGATSEIWAFTEFPVWASTSFTCSWLLPIFITCLYSFSFLGFLLKVTSEGSEACWTISPGGWAFISLDKSSSSLHCYILLKCQSSLLLQGQFCCQLLA